MRRIIGSVLIACSILLGGSAVYAAQQSHDPGVRSTVQQVTPALAPDVPREPLPARTVGEPKRVKIPAINVNEGLHGVGLTKEQEMEMPDYGDAAWYDEGIRPGSPGAAVIVAHVRGPQGPDVFWDLKKLSVGDRITTVDSNGSTTFVVDGIEQVKKSKLPYDRIWVDSERPVLRLITCAGTPGPKGFPDNTVVYAHAE